MPKAFTCAKTKDSELISHNYVEISIDPHLLNNFANEEGIGAFLEAYSCSDEFQELKNELLEEVINIIETCLTEKQKVIIKKAYFDGKTQMEIAKEINIDQSSVSKSLKGNLVYTKKRRYGGSIKKIRKLCATNEKIQEILKKMRILQGQNEEAPEK